MELTLKFVKLAAEKKVDYSFKYLGPGEVNGRTTLRFERHLPYTDEAGEWPDRVLIVDVDRELQVPVLCVAYADEAKDELLGRYEMSDVKLNVGLADSVFTKEGMGL
jgi:hypothetical protein